MDKIKNGFSKLWKNKFIIFAILLVSWGLGFFIGSEINYFSSTCYCDFTTSVEIDSSELLSKENLQKIYIDSISFDGTKSNYGEIDISKLVEKKGIYITKLNEDEYRLTTYMQYYSNFFIKASSSVSTRAKVFVRDVLEISLGRENITFKNQNYILINPYKLKEENFAFIFMTICTIISSILIFFINFKQRESIYNNDDIFKTPFHKKYWVSSSKFLTSVKNLTTFAMMVALLLVSKLLVLPSGFGTLGLSLGFIFISITGMMYGPTAGILIGFISDVLGHFLFNRTGTPFFFGYTIQAMLAGFSYGIFLYKTKITFFKVFLNRLFVNIICNVVIGSLCWGIIMNYTNYQTMGYMLLISLPKNLTYLIPQSIILYLIIRSLVPIISRYGFINSKIASNITLF